MSGCLAVPAAALSVALELIQDLHGYDNPWAAGGGKNKINAPDITLAAAGDIYNGACVLEAGTYTLSSSNTTVSVSVAGETGAMPITFTLANDISTIQIESSGAGTFNDIMIESGSTATTYEPYSNICPISGRTGTTVSTRNEDNTETASATISFGTTVYGGQVDFKTGIVTVEWGYIASYNGETLPSEWISDRDVYASGTTPTTGAEVAYKLATPTELTLTPAELQMLKGYNYITGDGVITITAYAITEEVGA